MSDLVVDTGALRATAAELRAVGAGAGEMGGRSEGLSVLVPAVGLPAAAEALSQFLDAWGYGLGLLAHDVAGLAGMLDGAAVAFETIETELADAAGQPGEADRCTNARTGVLTPVVSWSPRPPPTARPGPRWGSLPSAGVPVQLSAATHARQLVPGDPGDLETLAAAFRRFAADASEAEARLRRASLGGWAGQAAAAFTAHVAQVPASLDVAASAFGLPGRALSGHARVLADAQARAGVALRLWQDAEYRSKAARGAVVVASPVPGGDDGADADLARAAAMVHAVRVEVDASAHALRAVLEQATATAPRNPGVLARLADGIRSFGAGAGEGTAGMVAGVAGIVALGARLSPAMAVADPNEYLNTLGSVADAAKHAGANPWDTTKAVLDWETWASDPARAAGRLLPELLAALATAGAAGAAKTAGVARAGQAARALDADAVAAIRSWIDGSAWPARTGWTGEGGLTLAAKHNAVAEAFAARAAANEPGISAGMHGLAERVHGDLLGLDKNLKEPDSLKRKLAEMLVDDEELDPVDVLTDVKDTVRYTLRFDETSYAESAQRAMTDLGARGFEELKVANSWNSPHYRGINSTWRDPETGQVFEVQFHTTDSFQAKMDTHHWYEEQRLSATPKHRQAELQGMQDEVFAQVPHPATAESITGGDPVSTGRARLRGGAAGAAGAQSAAGLDRITEDCEP